MMDMSTFCRFDTCAEEDRERERFRGGQGERNEV
jgi:hypothetical protein